LTLSISEFRSGGAVSSLSDILETGDLPQRYFLSPKACAGILRRAERRGKELPSQLQAALTAAANTGKPHGNNLIAAHLAPCLDAKPPGTAGDTVDSLIAFNITGTGPGVRRGAIETETHSALRSRAPGGSEGSTSTVIAAFSAKDDGSDAGDTAPTLRAGMHNGSHANAGVMPAVAQAFYSTESRCDNIPPAGLSPPLKVGSNGGGTSGVAIAIPLKEPQSKGIAGALRNSEAGSPGDPMFTLSGSQHGVAIAHSLRADGFDASEDGTGRGTPLVAVQCNGNNVGTDLPSLRRGNGHLTGGVPAVAIQSVQGVREKKQNGIGISEEGSMYTLTKRDQHAVAAYSLRSDAHREGEARTPSADAEGRVRLRDPGFNVYEEVAPTVDAGQPHAVSFAQNQRGELRTSEVAAQLTTGGGKPGEEYPAVLAGETYADADQADTAAVLRALREAVGAKALAEWGSRILNSLQSPEILRQAMHGCGIRRAAREARSWLDDGSLPCAENLPAGALRQLWEDGPDGRSPQGRQLAEQLAHELGTPLPLLSHQDASPPLMSVRRLTPRETERLQGLPDNWTLVPYRGKPAQDGPRYRAIGNSMAVPVVRWIGRRIQQFEDTA